MGIDLPMKCLGTWAEHEEKTEKHGSHVVYGVTPLPVPYS